MQLEPFAEVEPLGKLAVGTAEVAHETRDDVFQAGRCERLKKRLRVPPAEEAAGVRDPEASGRRVRKAGEVVEVATVLDRHDASSR